MVELEAQLRIAARTCTRTSAYDEVGAGWQAMDAVTHQMPQPALDQVARHRRTHAAADGEAHSSRQTGRSGPLGNLRRTTGLWTALTGDVHDDGPGCGAVSCPEDGRKVATPAEPGAGGQHRQTVSW